MAEERVLDEPGYALQRAALASKAIKSVGTVDGRIGTGLDRPDVFNWFLEIRHELKVLHPNAVLLGFGGNDDKGYMTGLPPGVTVDNFDDPAWVHEYARRVGGLIDLINRSGAFVVWMGLPITADRDQTIRFDRINAVVDRVIRARPGGAAFVDTYTLLAGPDGYAEYLTNLAGQVQLVRQPDGVHLAPAGAAIVARRGAEGPERRLRPDELAEERYDVAVAAARISVAACARYGRRNCASAVAPAPVRCSPSERNHGLPALQVFQSATITCGNLFASLTITAFVSRRPARRRAASPRRRASRRGHAPRGSPGPSLRGRARDRRCSRRRRRARRRASFRRRRIATSADDGTAPW